MRYSAKSVRAIAVAVAAVSLGAVVARGNPVSAPGSSGPAGREYLVSTTGATALNQFTSMQGDNLGTILLGLPELRIGNSVYSLTVGGRALGNLAEGPAVGVQPPMTADRLVYMYHNLGSVNGINDLVRSNGLDIPGRAPNPVQAANPLWVMGSSNSTHPSSASRYLRFVDATANTAPVPVNPDVPGSPGGFYDTFPFPGAAGKPFPQIAWSDVRSEQGFAVDGTPGFGRRPQQAGYGLGESRSTSGKNPIFQQLANQNTLVGGVLASTTHLRNESLAAVPFTISASPGTGLAGITEADLAMLNVRGRLSNGADFNYSSRDIGSGTRNQAGNNIRIDPSHAAGERDRVNYGAPFVFNGVPIATGEETNPSRSIIAGVPGSPLGEATTAISLNEHRPSALTVYADKTSGTNGIRAIVLSTRMSLGVLSTGDVGDRGFNPTTTTPIRVLGVRWDFAPGEAGANTDFTQPTAFNVTTGRYKLWSASQAITVVGSPATGPNRTGGVLGLAANDTESNRPILNDVIDHPGSPGIVRKFLDNITGSIDQGVGPSVATPFEALINASFIPPALMKNTKPFDGDFQQPRTLSSVDPDGSGPALSPQALYDLLIGPNGEAVSNLTDATRFANPGNFNGVVTSQRYRIFDVRNTSAGTGNIELPFVNRTFLAGDLNGDGVRDIGDTAAWARAYANPVAFIAADTTGLGSVPAPIINNTQNDALTLQSGASTVALIPLTDLDGDGNVLATVNSGPNLGQIVPKPVVTRYTVDSTGKIVPVGVATGFANAWVQALGRDVSQADLTHASNDLVAAVTRADVAYFLFGAAIDTVNADLDESRPGVQNAAQLASEGVSAGEIAALRRQVGVRTGMLKINQAVSAFNAAIDDPSVVLDSSIHGSATKADLKFELRDVDGSGSKAMPGTTAPEYGFLADAWLLDAVSGLDYTKVADSVSVPVKLPRFALSDANTVIDQADMDVMAEALRTTPGVNPTGRVDHVWAMTNVKPGSLVIAIEADAGAFTVPNGGTLTINAGGIAAGGSVDPFSNGSNRLNIINNSMGVGGVGGLAVTAGTKAVGAIAGTGRTTVSGGALVVNPGASSAPVVALQQSEVAVTGGTLRLAAGTNSVAIVDTLSVSGGGFFDVMDNSLIVRSTLAGYAAEIAAVRALVGSWYTAAAGLPGTTGLGSSLAFYPAAGAFTTLAVYDNSGLPTGGSVTFSTFAGQAVSATDILVKYTYLGDTNLDGVVDASDLSRVLQGINGGGTGWNFGDVNYDGVIDFADLGRALAALRGQGAPLGSAAGGAGAAIPEPAAMGLLVAAVPLMGRRRR